MNVFGVVIYLVARLHSQSEQCHVQGAGAGVQSHTILDLAIGGKLFLKLTDLFAQDK